MLLSTTRLAVGSTRACSAATARRRARRVHARREENAGSFNSSSHLRSARVLGVAADQHDGATRASRRAAPRSLARRDRLQADHLVIVPHGLLHYLPFRALSTARARHRQVRLVCRAQRVSLCCKAPADRGARVGRPMREAPCIAEVRPGSTLNARLPSERRRQHRICGPTSPFIHIATACSARPDVLINPTGQRPVERGGLYPLRLSAGSSRSAGAMPKRQRSRGGRWLLGLTFGI